MTDRKKQDQGQAYTTSAQKPECQHKNEPCDGENQIDKPDFDEKDANVAPRRKASGPNMRTRNRSADLGENSSVQPPEKTGKPPEAQIKDDLPPEHER
ncbi:hypothetical protein [Marinobacter sp. ANT_B65]|uniref:hypothetical protein n=1 Tax=Marinobacter sp. ANT_B65 TaxID=2039467 RepID=UPI000BBEDE1C|nr:hypothetical protein [Marinobacter sp. ANT_B65]PCM45844.1 hypothetical protein CPA50_07725 [Marinobacter sp. ANT_B65]